mgnify:CR=1 FL=1
MNWEFSENGEKSREAEVGVCLEQVNPKILAKRNNRSASLQGELAAKKRIRRIRLGLLFGRQSNHRNHYVSRSHHVDQSHLHCMGSTIK